MQFPARKLAAALGLPAMLVLACASTRVVCPAYPDPSLPPHASVQVTFLGVGGFLIRWSGAAIMTAPLYSNPTIGELALSEIYSEPQRIDALMRQDVSDVRAILVGHAHYDHLMDVPYVALHRAQRADVIGNDSLVKLLAPIRKELASRTPPNQLVSLQDDAAKACAQSGHALAGTRFRVHALVSEHSPQIGPGLVPSGLLRSFARSRLAPVTLWRGEPEYELTELPNRAGAWPAGVTLAYVIDLLEEHSEDVAFRIYYQDSPTRRPLGYPPACLGKRPDLAILCLGGATEFASFPQDIVGELQPRYVLGSHWEDFFNPRIPPLPGAPRGAESIAPAPGVKSDRFQQTVRNAQPSGGQVAVPCPDNATTFARDASGWAIASTDTPWTTPKR